MRDIFQNNELNESFLRKGYVVIDLLGTDQVASLQRFYDDEEFPLTGEFYLTIWRDLPDHRLMVHNYVQEIIAASYKSVLKDYKPIISSFAVKQSGTNSAWQPHQDDTFVDEQRYVSLSIWIPLCDTCPANGTMSVLPGSHREYTGPRSPNIPKPFKSEIESLKKQLTDIGLKAGQALIFDHRLIHASGENRSGKERVAIVTVLIPSEAELVYLYMDKSDKKNPVIRRYAISERYYLEAPLGEYSAEPDPAKFRLLEIYPYIETAPASQQAQ